MKFTTVNSNTQNVYTTPAQRVLGRYAAVTQLRTEVETDLERDCFWAYYLPQLYFWEELYESRKLNKALLEWAMSSQLFQQSRFSTMGRMLVSSRSAELLTQYLLNDPEVEKAMKKQREAEELMNQMMQMLAQAQRAGEEGDAKGQAQAQAQANALQKQAEAKAQEALKQFEDYSGTAEAQSLRAGAVQFSKEQADEMAETMAAWGVEEGQGQNVSLEDVHNMMQQMNGGFLSRLAEQLGRAKGIAIKSRKPTSKQQIVITDAGYTRNPLDIFPVDRMLLLDESISPELHLVKMADYAEHGLIGMVKSSESVSSGAIYFVVDGSGSMSDRRHITAKALALGIGRAAEQNGQKWYGSVFGAGEEFTEPVGSESDPMKVLQFAQFLFNGGTDFDMAIEKSLQAIEDHMDATEIDIVFITDGECSVDQSSKRLIDAARKKYGIRFVTLVVDSNRSSINDISYYAAHVNSNEDIARATEGLAAALWNDSEE